MRGIHEACSELLARIKAAGYPGSGIEPGEVNPPAAVWIEPRGVRDFTLAGGATLEVWLWLVGPDGDTEDVMRQFDDGLAGLLELGLDLSPATDPTIDLKTPLLLPNNPNPLPAYRLAIDLEL